MRIDEVGVDVGPGVARPGLMPVPDPPAVAGAVRLSDAHRAVFGGHPSPSGVPEEDGVDRCPAAEPRRRDVRPRAARSSLCISRLMHEPVNGLVGMHRTITATPN